ncbi:DUF1353 domain-containing protein [Streptomyces sp. NPDC048723]|uniref:DUF1353 domain-containing protein n=1 Tax=Streptomyces sp. NPDC048723 TaxID=3365589 RepID=UPI0037108B6A
MSVSDSVSDIGPDYPVIPQPLRFYDGGVDGAPGEPAIFGSMAQIVLVRCTDGGREQFRMRRRIAYKDRQLGELLVPRETSTFLSDLTSVPALFTWLVPKTGKHLPATLLHDGLIHPLDDTTYTSTRGEIVLRVEADRVLRDAMGDAGTKLIRRWLIWSAVTMATMLDGRGTNWSKVQTWWYRVAVVLTLGVVATLGFWTFLDLIDVARIPNLPWMGDRPWFYELAGGLSGAVVIPLALALLWGPFRIAGAIVGVSIAVLLYVTVALLFITALYQGLEWVMAWMPKKVALVLTGAGTLVVLLVFAAALFMPAPYGR